MSTEEIFRVLEIDITKDENVIKQAYRKKLAVTNPEDNPEGFKRLRQAYEAACAYAKQPEEEQEEEQVDDTPSGQWVAKAKKLYKDITLRRDVKLWEQLFDEDVFLSLDGEEECREKLLVFMMDNFRFPTDVWKLFDLKMHIVDDKAKLKEMFPVEFVNYMVNKCQRGEEFDFNLFEGANYGDFDAYVKYYFRCWDAIEEKNFELAQDLLKEASSLNVYHPLMELVQNGIYCEQEEFDKAAAHLKPVYDKCPDDLGIANNYGEACWKAGFKDKAAEVYLKIKANDDEHYMANVHLAKWYNEKGQYKEAKECGEKVMSVGGSDEFFELMKEVNKKLMISYKDKYLNEDDIEAGIEFAWCQLQNNVFYAGLKSAKEMELKIPEEKKDTYYSLLTKLYYEEAMYEKTLETALLWREALKEKIAREEGDEKKKAQADIYHTYAARADAYYQLGFAKEEYFQDALKELEDLSEVEELGARMLMLKSRILSASGEPERAIEIADKLIEDKQIYAAYDLLLDAYIKMRDAGGVIDASQACSHYFPKYARGYDEVAKVFHDLNEPDELKKVLEHAKSNGIKSQLLYAYEYQLEHETPESPTFNERLESIDNEYKSMFNRTYKMSYYEKGYELLTELLYQYPSNYMLIDRGLFSMAAMKFEDAKKDFTKVLERTHNEQFALNNLGCVYKYTEDYEKALVCFRRAIYYMDDEPNAYPYGNLGHTLERMGEYEEAAKAYLALVDRFEEKRKQSSTINDVICSHARAGHLNVALKWAEENCANRNWVDNDVEYYGERFDACKDAGDIELAGKELERMEYAFERLPKEECTKYQGDLLQKKAWYLLVTGKLNEAAGLMREIYSSKALMENMDKEEVLEELLFMLSIDENAGTRVSQEKNEGFLAKIFKKKENTRSGSTIEAAAQDLAQELLDYEKTMTNPQAGNKFFIRQRYSGWLVFMGAYFTGDLAELQKAYEDMAGRLRCRWCNNPCCIKLRLAQALLLEKKGNKEEALEMYKDISEKYPFNWYSKAKVLYSDK